MISAGRAPMESISRWRKSSGAPRLTAGIALVLLASILVAGSAGADKQPRPQTWAQPVPSATLKNWYKVDADVYRSEQPTRKGFKEIRDKGIKTVINLRYGYSEAALVEGLDLVLIEIGMTAWEFTDNDILRALKAIESAPKPVLIHCQHGSDRTGVVVAMYRIVFLNWPKEEALAEMKRGGFGFHWIYLNIPAFIKRVDVARFKERLGWARAR
jgi:tyrosine-protein phosphatase SIW14